MFTTNSIEQFDLEGLTLQQLRYFNAVAEGETFADAAALIGISQSALSQGIARLEQVTGTRLLERDGRRRRITDAGELVAEYARRVLGESETLAAQLEERRTGRTGRLRVGMIDAAALYLFADAIAGFRDEFPEVALSIAVDGSAELEQRLTDFRDDVVIVVGPAARGVATHLVTEPMHLYGPDDSSDAFALYPTGSRTRIAIDRGLAAAGITPRVMAESGNPAVLRELCRLTGSQTVLPAAVAGPSGDLSRIADHVAERDVFAVTREQTAASPLVAGFIARLTAE
ncbi:MAG: LysR family transcriptional regulator [Acidimicrobiia bacterium]|nr:LysR family transcriptional regulator [Acidimicrobiia bacterium]